MDQDERTGHELSFELFERREMKTKQRKQNNVGERKQSGLETVVLRLSSWSSAMGWHAGKLPDAGPLGALQGPLAPGCP